MPFWKDGRPYDESEAVHFNNQSILTRDEFEAAERSYFWHCPSCNSAYPFLDLIRPKKCSCGEFLALKLKDGGDKFFDYFAFTQKSAKFEIGIRYRRDMFGLFDSYILYVNGRGQDINGPGDLFYRYTNNTQFEVISKRTGVRGYLTIDARQYDESVLGDCMFVIDWDSGILKFVQVY